MPNGKKVEGRLGRPKDSTRAQVRTLFKEWSDRTFARYWRAINLVDKDFARAIIKRAERPNGTLNVAQIEREAESAAAVAYLSRLDETE